MIFLAEGAALLGVVFLMFPYTACAVIGFFLLGFNAILAPNILYLAPESFGAKISQSVTDLEMAAIYVGVLGLSAIFGMLTKSCRYLSAVCYAGICDATVFHGCAEKGT